MPFQKKYHKTYTRDEVQNILDKWGAAIQELVPFGVVVKQEIRKLGPNSYAPLFRLPDEDARQNFISDIDNLHPRKYAELKTTMREMPWRTGLMPTAPTANRIGNG